jgi:ABC-2 type transport system ATP-binding protein
MIELQGISKSYGKNVKAVDRVTMKIESGTICGFLGPNGAGKTTAIKMITGILKQDEGEILINGIDTLKEPIKAKKQFGFVPDDPDLFLRLKGIEYLNFIADIYNIGSNERKDRIDNYAGQFEMSSALGDRIQSYSHGMRQKMIIIGVLIHDPSVWILDEPMTGLDPRSSFKLKEMMREHADRGNTVFFSTHVLDVAERICDEVAIINKGKLLYKGDIATMKSQLQQDTSLENMFLELTSDE